MIKVAIVEDIDDIRNGMAAYINGTPGYSCVGTYRSAEAGLKGIPGTEPNVVLMDIGLPGMTGIQCIRTLKDKLPGLQIMMLTVFEDEDRIFESIRAGASGYMLKTTAPAKLLDAVRELHEGGSPMSAGIARKVVDSIRPGGDGSDPLIGRDPSLELLTKREEEILGYLAKGFRYKEVADCLFISIDTVRTHVRNMYEKLHVQSRTEAVVRYLKR